MSHSPVHEIVIELQHPKFGILQYAESELHGNIHLDLQYNEIMVSTGV